MCILIGTNADLTISFFLSEVYDLCQLLCVLSSLLLRVFVFLLSEVIFRSRVVGACPVTMDCIVSIS